MTQRRGVWRSAFFMLGLIVLPSLASADAKTLVCTNPSSGAMWNMTIDFDRSTVDSFPATIGDRWITWENTEQNHIYEYERSSGKLTMRGPSSMGGYFLYYRCAERK